MRPRSLDEFAGQEHVVGEGSVLRRALDAGEVPSLILWGPPGSGKTTLAQLLSAQVGAAFEPVSATSAGVADLRRAVERARVRSRSSDTRTVLFIDEIHRFNKTQQDAVLPHVENGLVRASRHLERLESPNDEQRDRGDAESPLFGRFLLQRLPAVRGRRERPVPIGERIRPARSG